MKIPCFFAACLLAFIISPLKAKGSLIVHPANPSPADLIAIEYSTWLSNPGIVVTSTDQMISGYDIFLDLHTYQQPGVWPDVVVPYEHTFSIGKLPVGTYQVQANYDLQTTYFEVVPEPSSVALLLCGTGVLYLRRRFYNHALEPYPGKRSMTFGFGKENCR